MTKMAAMRWSMAATAVLLAAACEEEVGTGGGTAGVSMSEPQIAGVMVEANQGEIAAGQVALLRSMDDAVRTHARRMVQEHGAGNERLMALALSLNMDPADSGMRRQLSTDAKQDMDRLWSIDRMGFDRTYLRSQVEMHMHVLDLLDQQLIPSAQTPALRADLTATRSAVVLHLQDAQALLSARP